MSARAANCFRVAESLINGDRREAYGEVKESFARVAGIWSAILNQPVTPQQVALCMVALKLCREAHAHSFDNLVDICGYAGLLEKLTEGDGGTRRGATKAGAKKKRLTRLKRLGRVRGH